MKARKPNPCIGCGWDVPDARGRAWVICEDCRAAVLARRARDAAREAEDEAAEEEGDDDDA